MAASSAASSDMVASGVPGLRLGFHVRNRHVAHSHLQTQRARPHGGRATSIPGNRRTHVPVSHNEVIDAATARPNPFGVQIGGSRYYLRCTDQAIRLYYLSTEVASIVGNTKQMTVGGVPVYIAGVQTINTRNDLQGNGFGKLVALAFYAYWQAKGATRVTLVTRDT